MGEIKKKLAAREATRNVQMVQTINVSGTAQVMSSYHPHRR